MKKLAFLLLAIALVPFSAQASPEEDRAQEIYNKFIVGKLPAASEDIQFYSGKCVALEARWDYKLNVWAVVGIIKTGDTVKTTMSISYTGNSNPQQVNPYSEYSRARLIDNYVPKYTAIADEGHYTTRISQDPPIAHMMTVDASNANHMYSIAIGRGFTYCEMDKH